MTLDTRVLPDGLSREQVLEASQRAAAAWSGVGCSRLRVVIAEGSHGPGSTPDGTNGIAFRRRWCRGAVERVGGCYDPRIASLTTLRLGAAPRGGGDIPILEADVELNAVHFAWSTAARGPIASGTMDLTTVLLHEIGHVIGLSHVCTRERYTPSRPSEFRRRVPSCEALHPQVASSVMVPAGDVAGGLLAPVRRSLGADDAKAACALYPRDGRMGGPNTTASRRRTSRRDQGTFPWFAATTSNRADRPPHP